MLHIFSNSNLLKIPSYRLDLGRLTPEMKAWIRNAAGITVAELLELCKNDVARERSCARFSTSTKHTSYSSEWLGDPSLIEFKESFACALEQFLAAMRFIPLLQRVARLSHQIVTVSAASGQPAHLIILKVDLSDSSSNEDAFSSPAIVADLSQYTRMPSVVPCAMSSAFVYTPRTLFDVSQSLICNPASAAPRRQAIRELRRLYPSTAFTYSDQDEHSLCTNRNALVSTFSIDTVPDEPSIKALSPKRSLASLRSWASSVVPSVPYSKRRSHISTIASPSSMLPILENVGPQVPRPAKTRAPRRERSYEQLMSSRHPYLHLHLPPPLVFANHPFALNVSNTSLESEAETRHTSDAVALSGIYQLNNDMERADAWFRRI